MARRMVARLLEKCFGGGAGASDLETKDMYALYLRLHFHASMTGEGAAAGLSARDGRVPSSAAMRRSVQTLVHDQLLRNFESLQAAGLSGPWVSARTPTSGGPAGVAGVSLNEWVAQKRERQALWKQGPEDYRERQKAHVESVVGRPPSDTELRMRDSLGGFFLRRGVSSVPFSGDGLFLVGRAHPGTALCLYPGTVYHPWDMHKLSGGVSHFEGNAYMIARFDNIFIDGMNPSEELAAPLGLGHLINHPPKGTCPNVMPCPYDAPSEAYNSDGPLRDCIPNRYFSEPPMGQEVVYMKTLALVTTHVVEDNELFLNYRMNPKLKYPQWYAPVDDLEDQMRWTSS